MTAKLDIRPANDTDTSAIWEILQPVIRAGETYPLPRDLSRQDALAYWFSPSHQVFVTTQNDQILETYYIRPNQTGGGAHVANCGYITATAARGKGIARAMCLHSQEIAKASGYKAIQFNFVIATNVGAIGLWQKLGFDTLCALPLVYDHPTQGLVDALVMFKNLEVDQ